MMAKSWVMLVKAAVFLIFAEDGEALRQGQGDKS
jgi:hypothetical protein